MESELLKECIADAKAVRAVALANAKAALEEAFRPKYEAMFAEKLAEEAEDEQQMAEGHVDVGTNGKKPNTAVKVGTGPAKSVPKGTTPKMGSDKNPWKGDNKADDDLGFASTPKLEENAMEEESLTTEDLDEIISELEAEVAQANSEEDPSLDAAPAPAPAPAPMDAAAPAPAPAMPAMPTEPDGDECPAPAPAPMDAAAPAPAPAPAPGLPGAPGEPEGDEEINLEELLASLCEEASDDDDEKEEKVDESKDAKQDAPYKAVSPKDANVNPSFKGDNQAHFEKKTAKLGESAEENCGAEEVDEIKQELAEYKKTVQILRQQINEVNLLNAKLLYTTKLLKEFSMDNSQKMRVVEAFDLTKNVREVKLTYAVMAESLNNFGGKKTTKAAARPSVVRITEGMASSPVASTKPTQEVINESVNQMASRFQKLAGINVANKK
jgi:hypothetical protein